MRTQEQQSLIGKSLPFMNLPKNQAQRAKLLRKLVKCLAICGECDIAVTRRPSPGELLELYDEALAAER